MSRQRAGTAESLEISLMSLFKRWFASLKYVTSSKRIGSFPRTLCVWNAHAARQGKSILSSHRVSSLLLPWIETCGRWLSSPANEMKLGCHTTLLLPPNFDIYASMIWINLNDEMFYITQVEFVRSQLVRARIKVSAAAETLQQHCATYNEYDPFLNPPQPSNPWLSDDPTYWIFNAPTWVFLRKQKNNSVSFIGTCWWPRTYKLEPQKIHHVRGHNLWQRTFQRRLMRA